MPNLLNQSIHDDYQGLFTEDLDALFVQPLGLTVENANDLRAKLRGANLLMRVVKNSVARRVMAERGFEGVEEFFAGPAAMIVATNGEEGAAISAAKLVAAWRKENKSELPEVKGGVMEKRVLGKADAVTLEKMPGKAELLSTISGQLLGPGGTLSAQLIGPGGRIAGALETHIDNLGES